MNNEIFEQQIETILSSEIPDDDKRKLIIDKIMIVWNVLSATSKASTADKLTERILPITQLQENKIQKRTSVGVPRDTYLKVLTELSEEYVTPTSTLEIKSEFSKRIEEEINKVYTDVLEREKAIQRFKNGASILSIRKSCVNDPIRFNLSGSLKNDAVKREIPSKYNLFILVNEKEDPKKFGRDERIEWRNLYLRKYNDTSEIDRDCLLSQNDLLTSIS
jgi:hypothetical protein